MRIAARKQIGPQPDLVEQALGALACGSQRQFLSGAWAKGDNVGHGRARVEGRIAVLKHHLHLQPQLAHTDPLRIADTLAVEDDVAGIELDQMQEQPRGPSICRSRIRRRRRAWCLVVAVERGRRLGPNLVGSSPDSPLAGTRFELLVRLHEPWHLAMPCYYPNKARAMDPDIGGATETCSQRVDATPVPSAKRFGKGRVVVAGTWKLCTVAYGHDQKLLDNALVWLSGSGGDHW